MARFAPVFVLAAAGLLGATRARAQAPGTGLALDQLQPTPAGDALFGVPSPFIGGHLVPRGLVMFDYARNPLEVASGTTSGAIVANQAFLNVDASLALWDRLLVSALLPVAVLQNGSSPTLQGVSFKSPSSAQIGDLRLGLRVRFFGNEDDAFQAAAGFYLHVPTAPKGSYAGEGVTREAPQVLVGGRYRRIVWSAVLGAEIAGSSDPPSLTYGGGLGVNLAGDLLQIGPEVYASTVLQNAPLTVGAAMIPRGGTTNAEALLDVKVRLAGSLVIGAAAGPGLTRALGTPEVRALGSVAWSPLPGKSDEAQLDSDQDGILDRDDACPYAFGPRSADPAKNGCPAQDRDEDGVPDAVDACPDVKGVPTADPKTNGCPADRDGDGVPDAIDLCPDVKGDAANAGCPVDRDGDGVPDSLDACPDVKGPPSPDPKKNGCPVNADSDGDGILDAVDACPHEKGPASADPKANGCPLLVRVRDGEIALLREVKFRIAASDPAPLDKSAEALLGEVRDVLAQHPELLKLEVQAHTDNTGKADFNVKISTARAESVRKWLVDHGVAAGRLIARGYGGDKPIADNKTADGRKQNRRVQIVIVEKK